MEERWIFVILGVVMLAFGVTNLSSLATRRRLLQKLLGETGTRIMYIILGIVFIGLAFIVY